MRRGWLQSRNCNSIISCSPTLILWLGGDYSQEIAAYRLQSDCIYPPRPHGSKVALLKQEQNCRILRSFCHRISLESTGLPLVVLQCQNFLNKFKTVVSFNFKLLKLKAHKGQPGAAYHRQNHRNLSKLFPEMEERISILRWCSGTILRAMNMNYSDYWRT